MLPSRPRSRSGSWGGGPRTPPPPPACSSQATRHERSRSTTLSSEHGSDMTTGRMVLFLQESVEPRSEEDDLASTARVQVLERQIAAAKQTETKMLESLAHQTRQLEQAKIALEEAKLEVATLRQGPAAAGQWSVMDLMFGGVDDEINGLRAKLRAAVLAEDRSRKTADDLAAALSAVTMEAKQVKAWLSDAQAELERANAELGRLEGLLRTADAELWSATEQLDGVTSEWKEAADVWRAREKALLARARAAEDDADGARQENTELHRAVDDERRALERAVEEANAANESLEFATGENFKLRDALAEKEGAVESLRKENEALKASEAAAQARAKDFDDQPAAAATKNEKAAGLPLEKWRSEAQGKLGAAFLDSGARVVATARKDHRMFASISNIAELRSAATAAAMDDYDYEFDHFDQGRGHYGGLDHAMKHRKRRSVLRKFGDFFRRRSFHKSEFVPVAALH